MKELMKKTQDNWYPCYVDNQVIVYLDDNVVSVWGEDDFGLEIYLDSKGEAEYIFEQVDKMEYVNIKDLKNLGFRSY